MTEMEKTRVLCMEDDAGQARLLEKTLERSGYSVVVASTGATGLSLVAAEKYDVILLDYSMPGCSGIDILRSIRAQSHQTPIIMLTGNGNEKIAVDALKAGASDYLVKDPDTEYQQLLPIVIEQVVQQERLIRERERVRMEVKESEERYRALVELSMDGIAVISGVEFVFVNPAGRAILGAFTEDELLGKSVLEFIQSEFRPMMRERLEILGRERVELPRVEEKLIRLDGREIDVELIVLPFTYKGEPAIQLVFRDVTEQNLARQHLEHLAKFDPLTSLPNRALFFDRINRLLDSGKRYPQLLALLFLDLDRFKEINDRHGHDVGDQLLQQVAVRLTSCLRDSDSVARIGGDEFAIILTRIAEPPDAGTVARKIIKALTAPYAIGMHICSIGASVGISIFPGDGIDADALLQQADAAMYLAKENGRNTFRFAGCGS